MKVSFWAEVRRLHEVEGLSRRAIAMKLCCCRQTVGRALDMPQPPNERVGTKRGSILDPYKEKIDVLVTQSPNLSAVRVTEEIRKGSDGYRGSVILVRRYLRKIRPVRGRVYQEVTYEPGQAMQCASQ